MDYIDLVLAKLPTGKVNVYQAPEFSCLKQDDEILVKAWDGQDLCAKIVDVIAIRKDSDEFRFIMEIFDIHEPYRVSKKVTYKEFDYSAKDGDAHG